MKTTLILIMLFAGLNIFGQTKNFNDTTFKVQYGETDKDFRTDILEKTALFVNEEQVNSELFETIDFQKTEFKIEKESIEIDGKKYETQVYVTTKSDYEVKPVTLNVLKEKHTTLEKKPVVFMINNEIINADYDKFQVDENNLLRIIIDEIKNNKEEIDIYVIKLLTKTEENIKKVNLVRIR